MKIIALVATLAGVGVVSGQLNCPGNDGWVRWTSTAGTRAFEVCAKRDDAASEMNFQMRMSGLANGNEFMALGVVDGSVGQFMTSGIDVMMVNQHGVFRRLSSTLGEPGVFSGQTDAYGVSNFVGTHSAGETTASWSRAYDGGANGEHALGCCGQTFSHWVVASGPCGGQCSGPSPSFSYHGGSKTWTTRTNLNTCSSFNSAACTPTTTPAPTSPPPPVSTALFDIDAVCAGKGGFVLPAPDTNAMRVCWEPRGSPPTAYKFYMQTTIGPAGYAAFGISRDNQMAATEIYWLEPQDESAGGGMTVRYATARSFPQVTCASSSSCNYLQNTVRTAANGVVQYTFERPIVTTEANHFDLSDTNSYYFLFALNYNGKGKHSTKGASGSATSFASTVAATGVTSKFSSEQKIAHGIMMILAWVFLSPVATFTARFTKEILPAWKWFKTHMIMQIAAVTLTVLGIIVVAQDENVEFSTLVETECEGEALECSKTHVQLGMAVMAMALFQVLIGLLRKQISGYNEGLKGDAEHGDHGPRRWIFNLLHWTNGLAILIISLINVSIGVDLNEGWVKKPAKEFLIVAIVISLICAVLAEVLRNSERMDRPKGEYDHSVVRHLYALMASTALAATITMCTIVNDSDDV